MPRIEQSFVKVENVKTFIDHIENDHHVNCNPQGEMYIEGRLKRLFRWIFCKKDARLADITNLFTERLKQIEQNNPVLFTSGEIQDKDLYSSYHEIGAALLKKLTQKTSESNKTSKVAKQAFSNFQKHFLSFEYRYNFIEIKKDETISDKESSELLNQLKDEVVEWRKGIFSVQISSQSKDLTDNERALLKPLLKYEAFTKYLLKNPEELKRVFDWILLQKNPVDAFVEFYATSEKIYKCGLANHIGYINTDTEQNKILRVSNKNGKKQLQLKINTDIRYNKSSTPTKDTNKESSETPLKNIYSYGLINSISSLDENTEQNEISRTFKEADTKEEASTKGESDLLLKTNINTWVDATDENQDIEFKETFKETSGTSEKIYKTTLKTIFSELGKQPMYWADFLVNEEGINHWSINQLGRKTNAKKYESINLEQANWWEQLPAQKWVSLEQVQQDLEREHKEYESKKECEEKTECETKIKKESILQVNKENWVGRTACTRISKDCVPEGTHTYLEILIPCNKNNKDGFNTYSFGLSSEFLPRTFLQKMKFPLETHYGVIMSPDSCLSYLEREVIKYSTIIPEEDIETVMSIIKRDIQRGREKNLIYQIMTLNCARWVEKNFQDRFAWHPLNGKQTFKTHLDDGAKEGAFGTVSKCVETVSNFFRLDRSSTWNFIFKLFGGGSELTVRRADGSKKVVSLVRQLDLTHIKVPSTFFKSLKNLHIA